MYIELNIKDYVTFPLIVVGHVIFLKKMYGLRNDQLSIRYNFPHMEDDSLTRFQSRSTEFEFP